MAEENHRFCHDAMNCPYEVIIVGHTQDYARQASSALFDELDQMEQRLSRFIDHSDIGRIRSLNPGESTCVSPDTMDCLLAALWVHRETAGAFDVSLGQGLQHVMPDPGRMTVTLSSSYDGPVFDLDDADKEWGMKLDLGGIGKGHALDRMIDMLGEWGIENALVSAGGSTVLSVGRNGAEEWAIGINGQAVPFSGLAVSSSGKDVLGEHVLDPNAGRPAAGNGRAWAICPSATVADALSTAFMVMDTTAVADLCAAHEGIRGYVVTPDGEFLAFS